MNSKDKSITLTIVWVITSIIAIMSLSVALFVVIDKRHKKKEEKELEEYLETSIQ